AESQALGKRLLNSALIETHQSLENFTQSNLDNIVKDMGLHTVEELYEEVGLGKRMAPLVAKRLLAYQITPEGLTQSKKMKPLTIKGTEGLVVTYAKCCYPIPGDLIIGNLAQGQ